MQYRDLTIVPITKEKHLVVACDASASIGEKSSDVLKVPTPIVSAYSTRVALFELLSFGAEPTNIIHLVGNEFETTGRSSLEGVYEELSRAGFTNVEVNGSTEENMKTSMTSVAITAIGTINADAYNLNPLKNTDLLYRIGQPLVGQAVLDKSEQMATYDDIRALRQHSAVKDILPVGSKGMQYEATLMGQSSHLLCKIDEQWLKHPSLHASSGPATSILVGVDASQDTQFKTAFPQAEYIGEFYRIL